MSATLPEWIQKEWTEYKGYFIKVQNKEFTIKEQIAPGIPSA